MSDLINRQEAIDALAKMMPRSYTPDGSHPADEEIFKVQELYADCIKTLEILPSAEPEIIHCKDCKWYDTTEEMTYGYCEAIKHSCYSRNWEINIRRTYPPDFYCADAEPKDEEDEENEEEEDE